MAATAEHLTLLPTYETADRYLYEYDNTATWLAEVLDGSMRTSFEFHFDGHEVYGHDGTPLGKVFNDSLRDADRFVNEKPNLLFELRRRYFERQEYSDMLAMARGEMPNTMIVISDFPPELMDAAEDVGGYNVSRKQTMLRVITRKSDGTLSMTSQSLDRSDRRALEEIYAQFGLQPEAGELLGQRIYTDVDIEEQPYVVDRLTGIYDRSLAARYGGNWYAGRQDEHCRNTYDFVRQQNDLLDYFTKMRLQNPGNAESIRYNLAATMVERHINQGIGRIVIAESARQGNHGGGYADTSAMQAEMMRAGGKARAEGKVFSGCGASVKAAKDQTTGEQLEESGYGNRTESSSESSYKFDKKTFCVVCQRPPKKEAKPKWCGPCGICRSCDASLKKSGKGQ